MATDALSRVAWAGYSPRSGGDTRPFNPVVRGAFERGFGHDFSAVRVHTDDEAAKNAAAMGARAYTVGPNIVFGAVFRPDRPEGQRLLAHELAHVVQFATGRAHPGVVLREQLPGTKQHDPKPLPEADVKRYGIVYRPEGVTLRDAPSAQGAALWSFPFNKRVFVDSEQHGWYFVTTDDGRWGYCATSHVKTNLPEPEATIHWITPGETALDISRQHYGGAAKWGSDHRFYVNGLVYVNAGEGLRGIYKPAPDAEWEETQTRAGYMIWIPSLAFLQTLRGKVSSGSITHEAWQAVKNAGEAVATFMAGGAAFVAGLLHGALESLWDVLVGLKDLAVMLWDILKILITGNLISDAKALWDQLKDLDWGALVQGWLDRFMERWNAPGLLARWHFRGWVIGYTIMEVLLLVVSGGVIAGIKWIGKASKVSKILASLPNVQKFVKAVKASKAAELLTRVPTRGKIFGVVEKEGAQAGATAIKKGGGDIPPRPSAYTAEGLSKDITQGQRTPAPQIGPPAPPTPATPAYATAEAVEQLIIRSEAAGGHLVERHVGETAAALAERLVREPRIPAASTFKSFTEAGTAVGEALRANAGQVEAWIAGGARGRLTLNAPFTGGSVLVRGATTTSAATGVRVIVQGNGGGGWRIITAFPTP